MSEKNEEKEKIEMPAIESETESQPENKKNNKKKILFIIIGIIFILLLVICIFLLGNNNTNREENKKDKDDNPKTEEEKIEIDKEKYKYQIYMYKDEYGTICTTKDEYCNTKIMTIPVATETAEVADYATNDESELMYILISDGTYKIYNVKKEEIEETPIKSNTYAYLHTNRNSTELYGFISEGDGENNKDNSYYNLTTKKEMYKNKYNGLSTTFGKYISGYFINEEEDEKILLNINEEKEELHITGVCIHYDVYEFNDENYFLASEGCFDVNTSTIYNTNKNIITEKKVDTEWYIDDNGNLYVLNNNKIEKYNIKGELLSTSRTYSNPLHLLDEEYILYVEKSNIYISNGKESTVLGKWEDDFYYHWMISGYYNEGELDNENEKDAGYYFIFQNDGVESGIEYYFNPKTKQVKKYELEVVGGYAKPVLYLYPKEKTDVTINFEKEKNLTTTYPKFKEEWNVTAYPNGDLYDKNGKYYYGLYWEESSNHKVNFEEGFYVSKDNAILFLEEKLSTIGLNDKERNEFIMYWLPILEKNEHNLVYFELTEERDSFNKIEISPKPDSLLRVAIHVKKINGPQYIKEQKLASFERKGFTAVEWGGVTY